MRLDGSKSVVDTCCLCCLQSKAEAGLQEAREATEDTQTAKVNIWVRLLCMLSLTCIPPPPHPSPPLPHDMCMWYTGQAAGVGK